LGAPNQAIGASDGVTLGDVVSTTSLGFASVRREVTAIKRELALANSQQRSSMSKIDSIAVMLENVLSLTSGNRDLMLEVRDTTALVTTQSTPHHVAGASQSPVPPGDEEVEDASWVVDLRPVLVQWLEHNFANSRCPSDVWPTSATINEFLQRKIAENKGITLQRAATMLQGKWRLPVRVRKDAEAGAPNASVRTVAAKRKTPAYRFLHRAVSHFYQRIGITAVTTFSSRMHSDESLGTMRRVRGTRNKFEVVFSPAEAADMLSDNTFLLDAGCRAALMQAAHAVFSRMGLHNFSEPGPSRGGARNVVCRLAHAALVSLKVRHHLIMRAAPMDADGNTVLPAGLNIGHRDEWKKEMGTLSVIMAVQGNRAVNGLRLTDGEWTGRANADLVAPPPVAPSAAGDGEDDNGGAHTGRGGRGGGDDDGTNTTAGGRGGDNRHEGAENDWMAGMSEELHAGDGEVPPEGNDGDDELAGDDQDEEDDPEAYAAARESERVELQHAHDVRRRAAMLRTSEMVRLRAAQDAARRSIGEKDEDEDDDE